MVVLCLTAAITDSMAHLSGRCKHMTAKLTGMVLAIKQIPNKWIMP
jgi:hypothetical protein